MSPAPEPDASKTAPRRGVRPRGVRPIWLGIGIVFSLCFGVAIGWTAATLRDQAILLERTVEQIASAAVTPPPSEDRASAAGDAPDGPSQLLLDTLAENAELGMRIRDLEALVAAVRDLGANPMELVEVATDRMSDSDLERILKLSMRLDDEQLEGVSDLRAYTKRVAEVALDGTFQDPSPLTDETGVRLTTERPSANIEGEEAPVIDGYAERVYAIFEVDDGTDEVAVKWFRTDRPEILLLERHRIASGRERNWVWMSRPSGLAPGSYQVDIYSADEDMQRLAVGQFSVAADDT